MNDHTMPWAHPTILLLCIIGFACLALAMPRHQEDLFDRCLPARWTVVLRVTGASALVVALGCACAWLGGAFGLVAFSGHTGAAAGIVLLAFVGLNRFFHIRLP